MVFADDRDEPRGVRSHWKDLWVLLVRYRSSETRHGRNPFLVLGRLLH